MDTTLRPWKMSSAPWSSISLPFLTWMAEEVRIISREMRTMGPGFMIYIINLLSKQEEGLK